MDGLYRQKDGWMDGWMNWMDRYRAGWLNELLIYVVKPEWLNNCSLLSGQ